MIKIIESDIELLFIQLLEKKSYKNKYGLDITLHGLTPSKDPLVVSIIVSNI